MRYYGPKKEYQYTVLAKGFKPFETDNKEEALADASFKAIVSDRVTIFDDGVAIVRYNNGLPDMIR